MELRFQAGGTEAWSADAMVLFLAEGEKLEQAVPELIEGAAWLALRPARGFSR